MRWDGRVCRIRGAKSAIALPVAVPVKKLDRCVPGAARAGVALV